MSHQQAKFITFEGIEGVGKSTNIEYFTQQLLRKNISWTRTREPGGTPLAEGVRQLLLADYQETIYPETEALLLYAARKQHVEHVIKPALHQGKWVVCDRFFDATMAYQGGGRQFSLEKLKQLNLWTLGDFKPDLTLLLDAPVEIGLERIRVRKQLDRIEKEQADFFERIRACYLELAEQNSDRYVIIDASQPIEQVQHRLDEILERCHDQ